MIFTILFNILFDPDQFKVCSELFYLRPTYEEIKGDNILLIQPDMTLIFGFSLIFDLCCKLTCQVGPTDSSAVLRKPGMVQP